MSLHDISLRWWLVYAVYAYTTQNTYGLRKLFKRLRNIIQPGPAANLAMFTIIPIQNELTKDWIVDPDKIYSLNHDIYILRDEIMSKYNSSFGLVSLS